MTATPDALRDVIREVVRDVIREVIAEELAAAMATMATTPRGAAAPRGAVASGGPRTAASAVTASAAGDGVVRRGALTERHVRAAGAGGRITVTRAVVLTPLAKERAKAMGVEIIRIEE